MNKNHQIYLNKLLSLVKLDLIRSKHYRVLIDPANGAACEVLPALLQQAGCQVIKWNCDQQQLPQRAPEPRAESLQPTAEEVVRQQCALGVATDMDGDRVLFIDETGVVLSEDLVGAIFAQAILQQQKGTMVTPLNSSGIFKAIVEKNGGRVVESKVGPPEISRMIKKTKALFGYEESGKYFFAEDFLWADGLFASLKLLEIMAQKDQSLSRIRKSFPVYHQVKLAVNCLTDKMPSCWVGKGEKRVFGKSFLFIRASGTEPLIRIFSDSPSRQKAVELAKQGKEIVKKRLCGG